MSRHDDLELELQAMGASEVPGPDAAFLDALEQRLLTADAVRTVVPPSPARPSSVVVPFARPRRKLAGAGVVAAAVAFAGVAAAAGAVVITRPFDDDPPTSPVVTSTAPPASSTTVETTTTVEPATSVGPVTAPPTLPPTTVPVTVPPTVPPTVPRATAPPTTLPATPTTEVKVAPTMTIECFRSGDRVQCRWSAGPDGTASYVVLRSTPDNPNGTAVTVGPGDLTWIDPTIPTLGSSVGYLVHALDVNGKSLAHTPLFKFTCC